MEICNKEAATKSNWAQWSTLIVVKIVLPARRVEDVVYRIRRNARVKMKVVLIYLDLLAQYRAQPLGDKADRGHQC